MVFPFELPFHYIPPCIPIEGTRRVLVLKLQTPAQVCRRGVVFDVVVVVALRLVDVVLE